MAESPPDLLSLAQAGVGAFTKAWNGEGYEGHDVVEFTFQWRPSSLRVTRALKTESGSVWEFSFDV